jgi:Tfp pilus assembly protein PilO
MTTEDFYYLTITVLLLGYSVWMIGYMFYTSPAQEERRHNKRLEAIAKKYDEKRQAQAN